ncbi:ABC-type Mn2+/Zn2+ transport system ATPase subunit [Pullulanibacillus pueri]|uniref:ABC transporter ATP-binding protein n=1 Tax=Pullulanibacillus pueri TaxID=1437324 RepID=A0A8J2ZZ88_9BACL|nr:ABC transporter ATP-binding protein [Pullulanibacillus pueri]MBM7683935.1 ABC-type Mn2+/Zn2+ transport system ATPase subunit [Pullulanibacillus pueri]GGH87894.1 ABC transporter ATP-binding protein [Pullulanibacillus pueri]
MIENFSVDHIDVYINGEKILDNLSFSVQPGEMLGIIGPNGAGKSTLLKVILGVIKPQNGTVEMTHSDTRPIVGYVPQSRAIDEEMPIQTWDFISLGLPHRIRPWLTKKDRILIKETMELTDTSRLAKKSIGKLSGGEKQRVFLAQALVRNPDVLLLDESTANLDPKAQEEITSLVQELCTEQHISTLFISHDIHLVAKYAHRVLYLTRGHYSVGRAQDIIENANMDVLYQPQHVHDALQTSVENRRYGG